MKVTIQDIVNEFVDDLRAAISEEAAAAFSATLGTRGLVAKTARAPFKRAMGRTAKRTPEALQKLTAATLGAIRRSPGLNVEELADKMGVTTRELALPILKLRADKALRCKGVKRGTRYWAK